MLFLDVLKENPMFMQKKKWKKVITNMAARRKGLYFLRDTGPKKALKRFGIGKQGRKGCWKLRNMFYLCLKKG